MWNWIICRSCEGVGRNPHNGQECANCRGKGGWWDPNSNFGEGDPQPPEFYNGVDEPDEADSDATGFKR